MGTKGEAEEHSRKEREGKYCRLGMCRFLSPNDRSVVDTMLRLCVCSFPDDPNTAETNCYAANPVVRREQKERETDGPNKQPFAMTIQFDAQICRMQPSLPSPNVS